MINISLKLLFILEYLFIMTITSVANYDASNGGSNTIVPLQSPYKDFNEQGLIYLRLIKNSQYFYYQYITYKPPYVYISNDLNDLITVGSTFPLISADFSCVVRKNSQAMMYYIAVSPSTNISFLNMYSNSAITSSNLNNSNIELGSKCVAYRFINDVYRWNSTAFVKDNSPSTSWTNPKFSKDFTVAVADNGLYFYSSNNWQLISTTLTIYTNRKIWVSGTNVVVLTWDSSFNTKVYAFSSSTPTEITSARISCQLTAEPLRSISSTLNTIIIYGNSTNGNSPVYFGKIIDFSLNQASNIEFPDLILNNYSILSTTDLYLYARLTDSHAGFFFNGLKLVQYFSRQALPSQLINNNYKKSVFIGSNKFFEVYHDFSITGGIISIEKTSKPLTLDRTLSTASSYTSSGSLTIVNDSFIQLFGKLNWFVAANKSDNSKRLYALVYFQSDLIKKTIDISLPITTNLQKVSIQGKCAIIYDSSTQILNVYKFNLTSTSVSATASVFKDITNLVTVPLNNTAVFDISDDCYGLRIDSTIYHWNSSSSSYSIDTVPSNLISASLFFNNDFTVGVNQVGIFNYTGRNGSNPGQYKLNRAQNYLGLGMGMNWVNETNLVIFRYKQSSTANKFDYIVQTNSLVNNIWTKIDESIGKSTGVPKLSISQKLSKYVIYGTNADSTQFHMIKSFNFKLNISRTLFLPNEIKNLANDFSVSQKFLYVRNLDGTTNKQYAYAFTDTLIPLFNSSFSYTSLIYQRTLFIQDIDGKMIYISQFDFGYPPLGSNLIKTQKKTIGQSLSPKNMYDFDFSYSDTSITQITTTSINFCNYNENWYGKLIYMTGGDKIINQVYYNFSAPTLETKKVTISLATALTNVNTIKAISSTGDCVISVVSTSTTVVTQVNVHAIGTQISFISNVYSTISSDINGSTLLSATYSVSNACWAVKLNRFVYLKSSTNSTYAKSITASGFSATSPYDMNFNITYYSGKIYSYGTDYIQIITGITDFKTNIKLWLSNDSKIVLVLTYSQTVSPVSFIIRIYCNTADTIWTSKDVQNFTTAFQVPKVYFTSNMDTIAVSYKKTAGQTTTTLVKNIVFSTATITNYTLTSDFNVSNATNYVYVDDKYLHLIVISPLISREIFYFNNKTTFNLTQISRRSISPSDFSNSNKIFLGFKFFQVSGSYFAVYYFNDTANNRFVMSNTKILNVTSLSIISSFKVSERGLTLVNDIPTLCQMGCLSCTVPVVCVNCVNGWVLEPMSNLCFRCSSSCKSCLSSSFTSNCTSCFDGFYLSSSICLRCPNSYPCLTCNGATAQSCLSCKLGNYLSIVNASAGTCSACSIDNCNICLDATTCSVCSIGYVYSSNLGFCIKCTLGCTLCKPQNVSQCLACSDGFRAILESNTGTVINCSRCSNYCKRCDEAGCLQCRSNYKSSNGKCVRICRLPCWNCSDSDPSSCLSCIAGYTLVNNTCSPDLACNSDGSCSLCPLGYNLIIGKCIPCQGGNNCTSCSYFDPQQCTSCDSAYYLNASLKCVQCFSKCLECENQLICKQCEAGYVLIGINNVATKCTKCSKSCATCYESPTNCQTCAQGYKNSGWNCINQYMISMNFKFMGDFLQFKTTDLLTITQQICSSLQIQASKFDIYSINSGSIMINMVINTVSAAQQNLLLSPIQSLKSSNSIGGFPVQSISYNVAQPVPVLNTEPNNINSSILSDNTSQNAQSNKSQDNKNLIIIIAISVPVGTVILITLIVFLMKKGVIQPPIPVVNRSKVKNLKDFSKSQKQISNESTTKISKNSYQKEHSRKKAYAKKQKQQHDSNYSNQFLNQTDLNLYQIKNTNQRKYRVQENPHYYPEVSREQIYISPRKQILPEPERRKRKFDYSEQIRRNNQNKMIKSREFYDKQRERDPNRLRYQVQEIEQNEDEIVNSQIYLYPANNSIPKRRRHVNQYNNSVPIYVRENSPQRKYRDQEPSKDRYGPRRQIEQEYGPYARRGQIYMYPSMQDQMSKRMQNQKRNYDNY